MNSKLIIFEGGDGTGKSTQARLLCRHLEKTGRRHVHLREPGSTDLGERIRRLLLEIPPEESADMSAKAEVLLYMASRAQLFSEKVAPALAEGAIVVLERSYFSTYAYQGHGLGLDLENILSMGEWATEPARPWRVIQLDMDPEESFGRIQQEKDRVESRDLEYHKRVRAGFLELANRFPDCFRIISCAGSIEEVHARVLGAFGDDL